MKKTIRLAFIILLFAAGFNLIRLLSYWGEASTGEQDDTAILPVGDWEFYYREHFDFKDVHEDYQQQLNFPDGPGSSDWNSKNVKIIEHNLIEQKGIVLKGTNDSYIEIEIPSGVGKFEFVFAGLDSRALNKQLEVTIFNRMNNKKTKTINITSFTQLQTFEATDFEIAGEVIVTLKIKDAINLEAPVIIDRIGWTPYDQVKITFDPNGGTGFNTYTEISTYNSYVKNEIIPTNTTRTGYNFIGWSWYDEANNRTIDFDVNVDRPLEDITLKAVYELIVYEIIYVGENTVPYSFVTYADRDVMFNEFLNDFYDYLVLYEYINPAELDQNTFKHGPNRDHGFNGIYTRFIYVDQNIADTFPEIKQYNTFMLAGTINKEADISLGKFINHPDYNKWVPLVDLIDEFTKINPDQRAWGSPYTFGLRLAQFIQKINPWPTNPEQTSRFYEMIDNVPEQAIIPRSFTYETDDFNLAIPFRTNATFMGWYDNETLQGEEIFTITPGITGDEEYKYYLYPSWTYESYKVTYDFGRFGYIYNGQYNNKDELVDDFLDDWIEVYGGNKQALFNHFYSNTEYLDGVDSGPHPRPIDLMFNHKNRKWFWLRSYIMDDCIYNNPGLWTALDQGNSQRWRIEIHGFLKGITYENPDFFSLNFSDPNLRDGFWRRLDESVASYEETFAGGRAVASIIPKSYHYSYVFEAWYDNPNYSGNPIQTLPQTTSEDITLYAKWNKYRINYHLNDGHFDPARLRENYDIHFQPTLYRSNAGSILEAEAPHQILFRHGTEVNIFPNRFWGTIGYRETGTPGIYEVVEKHPYGAPSNPVLTPGVLYNTYHADNANFHSLEERFNRVEIGSFAVFSHPLPTTNQPINNFFIYINSSLGLEEPIRSGYTFAGWYDNPVFNGQPYTKLPDVLSGNLDLYAKWEPVGALKVIYHLGEHGYTSTISKESIFEEFATDYVTVLDPGRTVEQLMNDFFNNSWLSDDPITGIEPIFTYENGKWEWLKNYILDIADEINPTIAGHLRDHNQAHWRANLDSFWYQRQKTVGFPTSMDFTSDELANGYLPYIQYWPYIQNETVNIIEKPFVSWDTPISDSEFEVWSSNYLFASWYDEYGRLVNKLPQYIKENLNLYASYSPAQFEVTYMEGNTELDSGAIIYNNKIAYPTSLEREGYTLSWYTNPSLTTLYDFDTLVTGDITLYAKYDVITYNLKVYFYEEYDGGYIPLGDGETITSIYTGYNSSAALTSDNRVLVWGNNNCNMLGEFEISPTYVDITNEFNLSQGEYIKEIALGDGFGVAYSNNNKVFTWGLNNYGQLGINSPEAKTGIVEITNNFNFVSGDVIKKVVASKDNISILTNGGRLFMWGRNSNGQIGDRTYATKYKPLELTDEFLLEIGEYIIDVEIGDLNAAVITSTGKVFVWGNNDYGQIGDNTLVSKARPVNIDVYFTDLASNDKIKSLSIGKDHIVALSENGEVFAWGNNNYGQLALTSSNEYKKVPTKITSMLSGTIKEVYAGSEFSVVVATNNKVYTFGNNSNGQLGVDSSTTQTNTPQEININNQVVKDISLNHNHVLLLTNSSDLYLWGANSYGQLGNGTTTNLYQPTKLKTIKATEFKTISLQYNQNLANHLNPSFSYGNKVKYMFEKTDLTNYYNVVNYTTMPAKDLSLYVIFSNDYIVRFIDEYHDDYIEVVEVNSTLIEPSVEPKIGYAFKGWFVDLADPNPFNFNIPINNHLTLYAKWELEQYTINYVNAHTYSNYSEMIDAFLTDFYNWLVIEDFINPSLVNITTFKGNSGYNQYYYYLDYLYRAGDLSVNPNQRYFINHPVYNMKWIAFFDVVKQKYSNPNSFWGDGPTTNVKNAIKDFFTSNGSGYSLPTENSWEKIESYNIYTEEIILPKLNNNQGFFGWYDNPEFNGEPIKAIAGGLTGDLNLYLRWNKFIPQEGNHILISSSNTLAIRQKNNIMAFELIGSTEVPNEAGYTYRYLGTGTGHSNTSLYIAFNNNITDGNTKYADSIKLIFKYIQVGDLVNVHGNNGWAHFASTGRPVVHYVDTGYLDLGTDTRELESAGLIPNIDIDSKNVTWYENRSQTEEYNFASEAIETYDKVLYGKVSTYNIYYELDGGQNHELNFDTYTDQIIKDAPIKLFEPTKSGYDFAGWYTTPSFQASSKVTEIAKNDFGEQRYYARWTPQNGYKIFYVGARHFPNFNVMQDEFLEDFYMFLIKYGLINRHEISLNTFKHGVGNIGGFNGIYDNYIEHLYSIDDLTKNFHNPKFINQAEYNAKWIPLIDMINIHEGNDYNFALNTHATNEVLIKNFFTSSNGRIFTNMIKEYSEPLTTSFNQAPINVSLPNYALNHNWGFFGWHLEPDFSDTKIFNNYQDSFIHRISTSRDITFYARFNQFITADNGIVATWDQNKVPTSGHTSLIFEWGNYPTGSGRPGSLFMYRLNHANYPNIVFYPNNLSVNSSPSARPLMIINEMIEHDDPLNMHYPNDETAEYYFMHFGLSGYAMITVFDQNNNHIKTLYKDYRRGDTINYNTFVNQLGTDVVNGHNARFYIDKNCTIEYDFSKKLTDDLKLYVRQK